MNFVGGSTDTFLSESGNATGTFDQPGDEVGVFDPGLKPQADYGGSTQTHAPFRNSPVIGAADNSTCPATDQRGVKRPKDGDSKGKARCDVGAVEKKAKKKSRG